MVEECRHPELRFPPFSSCLKQPFRSLLYKVPDCDVGLIPTPWSVEERFQAQLSASEISANVVKNGFPHLRTGPTPPSAKNNQNPPNERRHQRDEPSLVAWWGNTSPQPTAASTGQNGSLKTRKLIFHQQQHEDLCRELLHQGHNTH